MMKAGATYDWKLQELILDWRNQRIKVNASCKQKLREDSDSEEYDESDDEEKILFQGNYKQD